MEHSFTTLERCINEKKPGYIIKKVSADGLYAMRSFQEGLKICYQDDVTIEDVIAKLRNEVLHNYNFYSEFSSDEVNILTEFDNSLKNPLKYCNSDTVDLFLMALSNAYQCRIVIYNCTETNTWTNDLRNNKAQYEKFLHFAKTELSHLDLVVDSKKIRNTDLFAGEPNNNNPTEINTKQENVVPANKQNNNSPTEIDIKEEYILEKYTSNTRTLSETKPYVSRRDSGKIYISEHYWEEENPVFANNLPYDIDDKCEYVLPINEFKRFESTKDGRSWSNIRESKRSNFSGHRYMSTCRGSYECYNPQCPHLM